MTDKFAHVKDNQVVKLNIRRGTVYLGKKYGMKSPDETYAAHGLYAQSGGKPEYDSQAQILGPPTPVIDEVEKTVTVTWAVLDREPEHVRSRYKNNLENACEKFINQKYSKSKQCHAALGVFGSAVALDMCDHIQRVIVERDRVTVLLDAATTVAGLQTVESPVFPEE